MNLNLNVHNLLQFNIFRRLHINTELDSAAPPCTCGVQGPVSAAPPATFSLLTTHQPAPDPAQNIKRLPLTTNNFVYSSPDYLV